MRKTNITTRPISTVNTDNRLEISAVDVIKSVMYTMLQLPPPAMLTHVSTGHVDIITRVTVLTTVTTFLK